MYPHVKQFETRRQELEQRFGVETVADRSRATAHPSSRHKIVLVSRVIGRRLQPGTDA